MRARLAFARRSRSRVIFGKRFSVARCGRLWDARSGRDFPAPRGMSTNPQPPARKPPSTIWDVARAAGVSVGTVSKALNGRGQLRDETRTLVRSVAQQLG